MKKKVYAAIDIGSNAVRLLIKELRPEEDEPQKRLFKVMLLRVPLRLGFDVFGTGSVGKQKAENLLSLMKAYRQLMKIYQVTNLRACATSAMRDASNGGDLMDKIFRKTGIRIDIIGGQEEAKLINATHLECQEDRKGNFVYVDVGGGSTEISFVQDGISISSASYNIGTVRLLLGQVRDESWQKLKDDMRELVLQFKDIDIIGSGGNINKLLSLAERSPGEGRRLSIGSLQGIYQRLAQLSVQERQDKMQLKEDRADVIVPAAEIFLTIAQILNTRTIYVPKVGLADGMIDRMYEDDNSGIVAQEEQKL